MLPLWNTVRDGAIAMSADMHGRALASGRETMSGWRWLLFAAMTRLQLDEDAYLGISGSKTIAHDVPVVVGDTTDTRPKRAVARV